MSTHNICFYGEAILMSTHNICFYGELTKIILELFSDTFLSVPLIYLIMSLLNRNYWRYGMSRNRRNQTWQREEHSQLSRE